MRGIFKDVPNSFCNQHLVQAELGSMLFRRTYPNHEFGFVTAQVWRLGHDLSLTVASWRNKRTYFYMRNVRELSWNLLSAMPIHKNRIIKR
jgi:hypothetical protein